MLTDLVQRLSVFITLTFMSHYSYMYVRLCLSVCMCVCVRVCSCLCAYIYTHKHTHMYQAEPAAAAATGGVSEVVEAGALQHWVEEPDGSGLLVLQVCLYTSFICVYRPLLHVSIYLFYMCL